MVAVRINSAKYDWQTNSIRYSIDTDTDITVGCYVESNGTLVRVSNTASHTPGGTVKGYAGAIVPVISSSTYNLPIYSTNYREKDDSETDMNLSSTSISSITFAPSTFPAVTNLFAGEVMLELNGTLCQDVGYVNGNLSQGATTVQLTMDPYLGSPSIPGNVGDWLIIKGQSTISQWTVHAITKVDTGTNTYTITPAVPATVTNPRIGISPYIALTGSTDSSLSFASTSANGILVFDINNYSHSLNKVTLLNVGPNLDRVIIANKSTLQYIESTITKFVAITGVTYVGNDLELTLATNITIDTGTDVKVLRHHNVTVLYPFKPPLFLAAEAASVVVAAKEVTFPSLSYSLNYNEYIGSVASLGTRSHFHLGPFIDSDGKLVPTSTYNQAIFEVIDGSGASVVTSTINFFDTRAASLDGSYFENGVFVASVSNLFAQADMLLLKVTYKLGGIQRLVYESIPVQPVV